MQKSHPQLPGFAQPGIRSISGGKDRTMAKNLLIVESPAKAKTINKYLGKDFQVLASYGHVRDLVPKEGAVDPDHDFAMNYDLIDKNTKHVDAIIKAVKQADALYLATDLDREGEAISWHIAEILREQEAAEGQGRAPRGVLRNHTTRDQGSGCASA
jgi:DNA topoisomerase IA